MFLLDIPFMLLLCYITTLILYCKVQNYVDYTGSKAKLTGNLESKVNTQLNFKDFAFAFTKIYKDF